MVQSAESGIDEFRIWRDDSLCYSIRAYLGGLIGTIFCYQTKMEGAWSGCMGFAPDLLPFVGRLDEITGRKKGGEGGEWISAGFKGEGLVLAWLCGVAIALMIVGDEEVGVRVGSL
jgi:glycine/D-amino acid oxidase-like deaminating enzyme